MYSPRLRTSPIWSACIQALATPVPIGLNLRESTLNPHDLSVPLASSTVLASTFKNRLVGTAKATPQARDDEEISRSLHVLLLTPASIPGSEPLGGSDLTALLERLTHLHALTGGRDLLIVFLLNEPCNPSVLPDPASHGLSAHSRLQTLLFHADISIPAIPITAASTLVPTLKSYITSLNRYSISSQHVTTPDEATLARHAIKTLLPLVTAAPPPYHRLTEHQVLKLTDLVGSVRELATVCASVEGREWLMRKMDEGEEIGCGRGIVEFFGEEFVREF